MINPDKVHRAKGIVVSIPRNELGEYKVQLPNGHTIEGWPRIIGTKLIAVGDKVNIQAQFSIMSDGYKLNTISRIMERSANAIHK